MVSQQDRDEMQKILNAFSGKPNSKLTENANNDIELAGTGQVTRKDVAAMADVLKKLNEVTSQVMTDSLTNPQLAEAVQTFKTNNTIKVGNYQIMIKEDKQRLAGKQYYGIYLNDSSNVIADDITLYEVALAVVRLLNSGRYVNSTPVRRLFEVDNRYTSNKTDAIRFKRRSKSAQNDMDFEKSDLFENRYQVSMNNAMQAKKEIKMIIAESRLGK